MTKVAAFWRGVVLIWFGDTKQRPSFKPRAPGVGRGGPCHRNDHQTRHLGEFIMPGYRCHTGGWLRHVKYSHPKGEGNASCTAGALDIHTRDDSGDRW